MTDQKAAAHFRVSQPHGHVQRIMLLVPKVAAVPGGIRLCKEQDSRRLAPGRWFHVAHDDAHESRVSLHVHLVHDLLGAGHQKTEHRWVAGL